MHGVKTMQNRRKLIKDMSIKSWSWIGANDIASQGNWVWVNGERARSSDLIWSNGEPDGGTNHDSVQMYGRNNGKNP